MVLVELRIRSLSLSRLILLVGHALLVSKLVLSLALHDLALHLRHPLSVLDLNVRHSGSSVSLSALSLVYFWGVVTMDDIRDLRIGIAFFLKGSSNLLFELIVGLFLLLGLKILWILGLLLIWSRIRFSSLIPVIHTSILVVLRADSVHIGISIVIAEIRTRRVNLVVVIVARNLRSNLLHVFFIATLIVVLLFVFFRFLLSLEINESSAMVKRFLQLVPALSQLLFLRVFLQRLFPGNFFLLPVWSYFY